MVEIPAAVEYWHAVGGLPDFYHVFPTAMLGWCLYPEFHGLSCGTVIEP